MRTPPRYLPDRILPARPYLPGALREPGTRGQATASRPADRSAPMPIRDRPLSVATWHEHEAYLWGVDLYNHGFPWEAHEVWEDLWRMAPAGSPTHAMLQALIQCAAAVIKARIGRAAGLQRLAARADGHLEQVVRAAGPRFLGVDVPRLRAALRAYALARPAVPGAWPLLELVIESSGAGLLPHLRIQIDRAKP